VNDVQGHSRLAYRKWRESIGDASLLVSGLW